MSLFCLGFGNDVDYSFLDVMCRQNKGVARRIFEGSDAAIQLKVRQEIKNINDCNMKINASVELLVCALHKWQQFCVFVAGFLRGSVQPSALGGGSALFREYRLLNQNSLQPAVQRLRDRGRWSAEGK